METAEYNETQTESDPPSCRYCKSEIKAGARVCPECDRWQMPFGWLASQVSLGDIALYGSLVVVVWSTFNIAILGDRARFDRTHLSCGGYAAKVYIANTGTSRGILESASAVPVNGSVAAKPIVAIVSRADALRELPVIAAGDGDVFRLEVPQDSWGKFDNETTQNDCTVTLEILAIHRPDGATVPISMPESCSCADFRS
ncbi:hypothetical protein [Microbaculum marinum]|uniref:Uncharacterized protein n=1 Tax=Microbaculum marinum TaxID=1764581 RepID=A0AAW9S2X7_9HYPH